MSASNPYWAPGLPGRNTDAVSAGPPARPQLGHWINLDELSDLQDRQLPRTLAWAAGSPYYRALFQGRDRPGTRADLSSIPLTCKQDLRDSYPYGMLGVRKEQLAAYHESCESAPRPAPSYYTAEDWADLAERSARKWTWISPSDTLLVHAPRALAITGQLAHAAARLNGATVVLSDNPANAMPYSRVVRLMRDLEVTLTWSTPTDTLLWAAAARALGYMPAEDFPSLRALFVCGEPVSRARRRRISDIWGVPVVEEYGSAEVGSLAGACRHGQLHLWADRAIFEVRDPETGRITRDGSGQLIVTPLYRQAMPLLRYNLEDQVAVSYEECGCGWRLPQVRILERAPAGQARITPERLEELVFSLPADYEVMFWRARTERTCLRVEIEVPRNRGDSASAELAAAIRRECETPCDVAGVRPGTLVPREVLTAGHDAVSPV